VGVEEFESRHYLVHVHQNYSPRDGWHLHDYKPHAMAGEIESKDRSSGQFEFVMFISDIRRLSSFLGFAFDISVGLKTRVINICSSHYTDSSVGGEGACLVIA